MNTEATITSIINQTFLPSYLLLENESHQHSGYVKGKESHFKLTLVSDAFIGLRLLQRHQRVYASVADLLTSGGGVVHALALHTYTPTEWQQVQQSPNSPHCASKKKNL